MRYRGTGIADTTIKTGIGLLCLAHITIYGLRMSQHGAYYFDSATELIPLRVTGIRQLVEGEDWDGVNSVVLFPRAGLQLHGGTTAGFKYCSLTSPFLGWYGMNDCPDEGISMGWIGYGLGSIMGSLRGGN